MTEAMMGGKRYSDISSALVAGDRQKAGHLAAHLLTEHDTMATRSGIARAVKASPASPQAKIILTGFGHTGILIDALTAYALREGLIVRPEKMEPAPHSAPVEGPVLHLVRIETSTDTTALLARLGTFPNGRILLVPDPDVSNLSDFGDYSLLDAGSGMKLSDWIDPRKLGDDLAMLTASAVTVLAGSAIAHLGSWLDAATRPSCKMILTDLDNTLWGGILGEDGADGIDVGSNGPVDFRNYQRLLKTLSRQGVLLAAVSRNRQDDVSKAFFDRLDMELAMEDFLTIEADWEPKAKTIARILEWAQVAPEAAVFIDDDPLERGQVAQAIPGLLVPVDGNRPDQAIKRLIASGLFANDTSPEDVARKQSTRASMQLSSQLQAGKDRTGILKSLDIRISFEPLSNANEMRARQLADRVTQFRTAMTPVDWHAPDNHVFLTRLKETGIDHGRIGLVIWHRTGTTAAVDLLCLSCRALNRDVETAMIAETFRQATAIGLDAVEARIEDMPRNHPARDLFTRHGFEQIAPSLFRSKLHDMAIPAHISIDTEGAKEP